MAVSKRLRYEVLRRDAHTCRYCGAKAPDVQLTVDHVVPDALGGKDEPSNLVTACRDCNAGKSSSAPDASLVEGVADDALRWAAALRRAHDLMANEREQIEVLVKRFDENWLAWSYGGDQANKFPRPLSWERSVKKFLALGMGVDALIANAEFSFTNDRVDVDGTWRYFCGVCWRKLEDQQELARTLLDEEVPDGEA